MNLDNYLNRDDLMRITGWDRSTLAAMLRKMRQSGRYPVDDLIRHGQLVLMHPHVFADWMDVQERKRLGEIIPPYKKGEQI